MHAPTRLTRSQSRDVDRLALSKYHIPGVILMENAARSVAEVAWQMIGEAKGSLVHVFCGGGNNGGDGLAAARHLHIQGAIVNVILAYEGSKFRDDALINWRIIRAMELDCIPARRAREIIGQGNAELIIDALLGTGLCGAPDEDAAALIDLMNSAGKPILAVDIPSGLNCDTGLPWADACVKATKTVTFMTQKVGFGDPASRQYTGEVIVADIGCPREVVDQVLAGPA